MDLGEPGLEDDFNGVDRMEDEVDRSGELVKLGDYEPGRLRGTMVEEEWPKAAEFSVDGNRLYVSIVGNEDAIALELCTAFEDGLVKVDNRVDVGVDIV